ncbi:zinc ribbon domain-containing protein [Luedemannella flava]
MSQRVLLRCGETKPALFERSYTCSTCGMVLDRDHNAARNLAALAAKVTTAGRGPWQHGADQKTRLRGQVATKRNPARQPPIRPGPSTAR